VHPQNSIVIWTIAECQVVVDLYTKKKSILTCGCWDAAERLCEILTAKVGSIMDIVHCYNAILSFANWYPKFQEERCLYRASQLPAVKALRLPYIEKAKDILSLYELVLMIYKGLSKRQTINIFQHYYGMNTGPLRDMERVDLVQKLADQLVSDLVGRDGTDDKQEEEVPAPFTVYQIQQVLQSAQNPSKPDPEPEEEEIAQNKSKLDLKRSHSSMEVNTAVKDGGGFMTSFETQGANHVKKCSIRNNQQLFVSYQRYQYIATGCDFVYSNYSNMRIESVFHNILGAHSTYSRRMLTSVPVPMKNSFVLRAPIIAHQASKTVLLSMAMPGMQQAVLLTKTAFTVQSLRGKGGGGSRDWHILSRCCRRSCI
jgi:hypothetical protein